MVKAGLGDEVVVSKIKISQNQFDLSTQAILRLKEDGVSPAVIKAMVETAPPPAPKAAEAGARETQDAIALYRQGKVVEATAAFDKLLAERPGDDDLKIWKALSLLEQARAMKDANTSGYKAAGDQRVCHTSAHGTSRFPPTRTGTSRWPRPSG